MKQSLRITSFLILSIVIIIILQSCKKRTLPVVTTENVSGITSTSAISGGNVTNNGGAVVTSRGICWGTTENPTISQNKTSDGTGNGHFTSNLTGLIVNTKYYVRAYAINSEGTNYGNQVDFITSQDPPVAAFMATPTAATTGQSVQFTDQSTNNPTSWSWNFGDGSTNTSQNPSHTYSSAGTYTVSLTVTSNTGSDTETKTNYITVTSLPVYVSSAIEDATPALLEITFNVTLANIIPSSSCFTVRVNSIVKSVSSVSISGVRVLLTLSSIISNGDVVTVTYSKPSTNPLQTASGGQVASFSNKPVTNRVNTITDVDGNNYNPVTIGTQIWIKENLKTTKYNDGSLIPLVTNNTDWGALRTNAYCWYDNNISYKDIYGALYNWYSVNTGKLCPSGWHVPTDSEWTILVNYVGGLNIAGGKLKEAGTAHWINPNIADNASGFTCLPGGIRHSNGIFEFVGAGTQLWSSTESGSAYAWDYGMENYNGSAYRDADYKYMGQSVRCIKD